MTSDHTGNLHQPFQLAALADYNAGSIVSRSVVKGSNGNVTFFAFAKGESLSPHSAPFDALLQVLAGRTTVTIDDKPYELNPGEAILMPANVPHAVQADEDMKILLTMVKG